MAMNLSPIAQSIARIIDLMSMGACDVSQTQVTPTVNPLVFDITTPLHAPVEPSLHTPLRKLIKQRCAEHVPRVYAGKITFSEARVHVTLYLERRITPAWLEPDPTPEKS